MINIVFIERFRITFGLHVDGDIFHLEDYIEYKNIMENHTAVN